MTTAIHVPVTHQHGSYEVLVGQGLLDATGSLIRDIGIKCRAAIVTDSNVAPLYLERLRRSLSNVDIGSDFFMVPAGEQSKSIGQFTEICEWMARAQHERSSVVIALGGGVVGDLAGFVSASFCRGCDFVQIPTTVMAQVDSSVGGKTGVNLTAAKNLVGAFHHPRIVIADIDTLTTLSTRDFNEGLVETVKHGIISKPDFLDFLERYPAPGLDLFISQNVAVNAAIVSCDEREQTGERVLLNFGHTVGHGIEYAANYGTYRHGEAIALGIRAALALSIQHAGFCEAAAARILSILARYDMPLVLPGTISTEAIMKAVLHDKKYANGCLQFVLARHLGNAFVTTSLTSRDIQFAIESLRVPPSVVGS